MIPVQFPSLGIRIFPFPRDGKVIESHKPLIILVETVILGKANFTVVI